MAPSRIRDVNVRRLWGFIARHGSSTAHFYITDGKHNVLSFHGLTEEEAEQMERENEFA
jgi:predicted metal-dependent RNase